MTDDTIILVTNSITNEEMRKTCSFSNEKQKNDHHMIRNFVFSLFLIFSIFGQFSFGQTSYTFTTSSETFTPVTGTTMTITGDLDQGYFNAIPIGFSFNYWGTAYTTVSASTNGWMTFGQNISNSARTNSLVSGGTRPLLAPLWDDLAMINSNDFSYTTTGTEGSRIFTAQWLNMKWNYAAGGGVISFQVKLYESSGMVQFLYRQESTAVNNGSASIGIAATATGINNYYSVQNTTPSATVSSSAEVTSLNTKPANGQVYSFAPAVGALIEMESSDPAVTAGNILQNSADNIIYRFECIVSQSDANMTGLQITTTGTYTASDISYLNAWYSADATFSSSTDFLLSRKTSALGPGLQVFPEFESQQININSTGYIFITADLNCASTSGSSIAVNAVTTADVTFQSGTKTALTYAGGVKTIQDATPVNVIGASASPDGTTADLSWTNPTGCYDEIMIVGSTASITLVPTGNGSLYTANTAFGSSIYNGESILYKGTSSPQTITSLLEGTKYYFKFFTRKGINWSGGIEINISTSSASTGNFRSNASGNWNSTNTWQYYNGTWGPASTTPTDLSGTISIRNGDIVTVSADVSADQVVVDAGGTLSISNAATLTISDGTGTDLLVNGTLSNSGNITTTGSLVFSGAYTHAKNGGPVPSAIWNSGSTCIITGSVTSAPANLGQTFHNFTWDCTGQTSNISLGGYISNIPGTFTVKSTGAGTAKVSPGGNATYQNYLQTGGTYSILGTVASARTINVVNFTLQGGTFNMSDAASTVGTLSVSGNFTHISGTLTEVASSNSGNIIFNGTSMQTYTSGGSVALGAVINFTVNPNAYLQMAAENTVISGSATSFTLSNSSTLGITSSMGINIGGFGNIQTRNKNFGTGANYLFNCNGPQETGDAITYTTLTGNVTVAATSELSTLGDMTINGSLTVNGKLIPGDESFVFDGTGTLNGSGIVMVNRISDPADFLGQYPITNKNLTNLTIEYSAPSGGQVISPLTFGKLHLSNTMGTNTLGGNVSVSSSLTTTAGGTLNVSSGFLLNAANVSNAGILTIDGTGKATIGNLVNAGTLNLNSTGASQNFSLMLDNYSGSGTTNISLYLTGGGDPDYKWHYVAVPANSTTSILYSVNENLMRYDDSKLTTPAINEGWIWADNYDGRGGFPDLTVKRGYSFYHTQDITINFNGLNSLTTSLGIIPLTYSGGDPAFYGFNLLGNSLTCGIDWNLTTESGDIDNTVYYLKDYKEAQYLRNVGGINGGTKDIPPLQGFIVKANAANTSLNFTNARQHTTQVRYKKSASFEMETKSSEPASLVKLELNNLVNQDETLVWFSDEATNSFEGDYDAKKFFGEGSFDQIYTLIGSDKIGINGLPLPVEKTTIPVSVRIREAGTGFKIIASSLQGLDQYKVMLTDKYNSDFETDLKTNPEYSFSSTTAGTFNDRFVLTISNLATSIEDDITIVPEPFKVFTSGNLLNIELLDKSWEGRKGIITIYNLSGNKVFMENKAQWAYRERKEYDLQLQKGLYIIEIKTEKERFVSKINLNL